METQNEQLTDKPLPTQIENVVVKTKYLSAFYLLMPIIIGICLISFSSLGVWKVFTITSILLIAALIMMYHRYITEEIVKIKMEYINELHAVHQKIINTDKTLRTDLDEVINKILTEADKSFKAILKEIHDDIHGKAEEIADSISAETKEEEAKVEQATDNTLKEIETGKD